MKVNVYSIEGNPLEQIELPRQFDEEVREEVIRRAVISEQSRKYQPKGSFIRAGLQTTAEYRGRKEGYGSIKNKGISRLPREKFPRGRFGKVKRVPFAVKGRRAHPPRVEEVLVERINKKEFEKALRSAIAATGRKEIIAARGHAVGAVKEIPLVVESKFEEFEKTKNVLACLRALGLEADLSRAQRKKRISGVRERRRGGTVRPKSVLIVVGDGSKVVKAARNLAGVDVKGVRELDVTSLAPGTHAGRLTLWSKRAIDELAKM
ncbi:MAG: 50S ribosomal protein L4 [Candidatus Micrarchaeota archaeon]|nr:50S ribosomal protein L4 [Candidatus Micrarchaeota archaeon]